MVSASEDRRLCCSRPGWSLYCCVVSLDKKRCSTLSLFTQVYKWVLAATAMDKHPFQRGGGGGGINTPCSFMLQKLVKFRLCEAVSFECDR